MVASGDLFKSEYSERRMIPIALRPVGVTAVTVRVADLEKPERIAELHTAIQRPEGGEDAYFFLILTSGDITQLLPVQDASGPAVTRLAWRFSRRHDAVIVVIDSASAADAQHDHDDVPQRTAVVEERKIEAVEAVIQPAIEPGQPLFLLRDHAVARIEVEPGALRIGVADA